MKKIVLIALAFCFAVSFVFARGTGDSTASTSEDYVLKIGYPVAGGLCEAPFYIAIARGVHTRRNMLK
jgi:hypothetical protein